MRFGLVMMAVAALLAGCGSSGDTHAASTSSSSAVTSSASTTTGAGGAPSTSTASTTGAGAGGAGGQGTGGASGGGAGGNTMTTSSSSTTTTGAGGAPAGCASAPDGTSCTETCGCPPCGQQPPSVGCGEGLCIDHTCTQFRTVRCRIGGVVYEGCNLSASSTYILWADGKCTGSSYDVAYCAPGSVCFVTANGADKGQGVCE